MNASSVATVEQVVPAAGEGLTDEQVAARVAAGLANDAPDARSRSLSDIIRANTFTWFNGLLGTLWVVMMLVAPPKQALFGLVIIFNTGIGIIQEYRASRELAKLSLIGEVKPTVVRAGREIPVSVKEIVRDDLILLSAGDQVVVDGTITESRGLELDESLLTGEADAVDKVAGDPAMSGSFVAAGSGVMVATKVGSDSFAAGITAAAKEYTLASSELRDSVNKFIRTVSFLIVPIGILLVISQLRADQPLDLAIQGSIAGMITMIPEGLVLLTSIAMAVAVVRLARRKALVQEMPAVEALARTDVVCVDKTGTLTDPGMALRLVTPLAGADEQQVRRILGALGSADPRPNPTMDAIRRDCPDPGWTLADSVPFSSARKWSSADYAQGSFVIGAPEMLFSDLTARPWWAAAEHYADDGARVLVLAQAGQPPRADQPLPTLQELAVVVIDQKLRSDAAETVAFFEEQGVAVKVISGDNAATVGAIAGRAGVPGADDPFDARNLPTTIDGMGTQLESHSVFGRVTPDQKKYMVDALQQRGHTVTMTGDGVNDVLALKRADLGIAMGSGAPATRAVAQIVLMDNKWSTLPQVVFEGRRVLGNIERVSDVFLTKSIYAMVISLATGVFGVAFPFQPIQLTLVSSLTIGIPGFFLALMPNTDRFRPGFFRRVLLFAVPAGVVCAASAFTSYIVVSGMDNAEVQSQTYATLTLLIVALGVLLQSARPLNLLRIAVVAAMAVAVLGVVLIAPLARFFSMTVTVGPQLIAALAIGAVGVAVILAITPVIDKLRRQ